MKKIIVSILAGVMLFSSWGCSLTKEFNFYDFQMSKSAVEKAVRGWNIYTNGTWRYEVRMPTNWYTYKTDENSIEIYFIPKEKEKDFNLGNYKGALNIKGVMNTKTKYDTVAYLNSLGKKDLLSGNYQQLEVSVGGQKGILIKNADTFYKMSIDELVLNLGDRILDVYIYEKTPDVLAVLNSMIFYGNKVVDIK